ncbi:Glutamyl-tRNA(Gln) amidotransferase subunit A 1 [Zalerion maritima]|uniref:Glutamyl-tRNA(Gln) amidotransferase subunit A 1 n=1 Tax=Zalerion maritima TaxID=339359 RepID=A0AAD5WXV3_9PEZI|nr:Glutamyl-tRNA(Gln) amidotransferase subunit A 1 [Zalerion maritima]
MEAQSKILSGELTVEDYARSLLSRIKDRDSTVKAWAYLDPGRVLSEARKLDAVPEEERGPMHGIAIGVKDVIYTKAGALILGKTTTTEFAATVRGPVTTNPHNSSRTPGGSSSGSGASVGDMQVPISLGTQTGGSTIRPGSYNGIFALKLTWGSHLARSSKELQSHSRHPGPVRKINPRSATPIPHSRRRRRRPLPLLRCKGSQISLPKNRTLAQTHRHIGPGTAAAFELPRELLANHGAIVEEIELPSSFDGLPEAYCIVLHSDGRVAFLPEYRLDKSKLWPSLVAHVDNEHKISRKQQLESWDKIAMLRPRIDEIAGNMWTALHTPVVNVPGFKSVNGMPIGLSLVGPRYRDQHPLQVAEAVGKIFGAEGGWRSQL